MSDARLRALRMVGFKSFAERTLVEFGPGISAIVGPNGSGKSNLADALRWALGEQGRALRTRRAEDLIFAGSSSRRAIGMADVTLTVDNSDGLLPVEYAEIEIGRRLYRSGENEYLLNRQRVRLRDLVDLLDEANLADNAFLFIGQGMVDQALALRPEERRPLFEEAAGIRKHERRRRAAEAELVEAESNLERVRDVLGELRPQQRRLAAQAAQQEERRRAAAALAAALVASARIRLGGADRQASQRAAEVAAARSDADAALAALRQAEEAAAALTAAVTERADVERTLREQLDAARSGATDLRLEEARHAGDLAAVDRDRRRVEDERTAIAGRVGEARRVLALPAPDVDDTAEEALRDAERALGEARREEAELRELGVASDEREARLRGARRARVAELEQARARAAESGRRLSVQRRAAADAAALASRTRAAAEASGVTTRAAEGAETAAELARDAARSAATDAEAAARDASERAASMAERLAGLRARREALARSAQEGPEPRELRAARALGARRLADGLEVEPTFRVAVEAALGDALTGLVGDARAVRALRDGRAVVLLDDSEPPVARERDAARAGEAAVALGGGPLAAGIRRDPNGAVARLLARCVWVPDLDAALDIRPLLPPGWRAVSLAGEVVRDDGLVRLGRGESLLERRDALGAIDRELAALVPDVATLAAERDAARATLDAAQAALERRRLDAEAARRARRVAEEEERSAVRSAEGAAREHAWQAVQLERLEAQGAAAAETLAELERRHAEAVAAEGGASAPATTGAATAGAVDGRRAELAAIAARVRSLEAVHQRRSEAVEAARRRRAEAEEQRMRADVSIGLDAARLELLDLEMARLVGAESDSRNRLEEARIALAAAVGHTTALADELSLALETSRDARSRLAATEAAATAAREALRAAEARTRSAEVAAMELRMQFEAGREALLVELAGIGIDGLAALQAAVDGQDADRQPPAGAAGARGPDMSDRGAQADGTGGSDVSGRDGIQAGGTSGQELVGDEDLTPALESALSAALAAWRALDAARDRGPGGGELPVEAVSAARIGALRRRYHELGASNPFAVQELAEVSVRLESLDAQRLDLESAIRSTRELIVTLNALITDQFRQTFTALEGAFARRFRQLFDGGEAQLTLTAPEDLSATGVEITARPPGKKRQPLAMLSGGERALTAVALLLAMLEIRPVPFCVLDEVDAALDEANVGRFSSALRGLAETIQFIVITHNRGTIEAADALYGVTVGDDAVSHVISLRLGDPVDGRPGTGTPDEGASAGRPGRDRSAPIAVPVGDGPGNEPLWSDA